jgi:hypothetical protein
MFFLVFDNLNVIWLFKYDLHVAQAPNGVSDFHVHTNSKFGEWTENPKFLHPPIKGLSSADTNLL